MSPIHITSNYVILCPVDTVPDIIKADMYMVSNKEIFTKKIFIMALNFSARKHWYADFG